jgi:hypothetical protein
MAGVQARPAARYIVHVSNECPCFFHSHARALRIRLKVQNQKSLGPGTDKVQEELRLLYTIAAGSEMISSPQEPSVKSAGHMWLVGRILKAYTLRGLVNGSENAALRSHLLEIHVLVVMG